MLGNSAITLNPISAQGFNLAMKDISKIVLIIKKSLYMYKFKIFYKDLLYYQLVRNYEHDLLFKNVQSNVEHVHKMWV